MAKAPNSPTPDTDVDDGNVSAEAKADFRSQLFETIAEHRSSSLMEGVDPESPLDVEDPDAGDEGGEGEPSDGALAASGDAEGDADARAEPGEGDAVDAGEEGGTASEPAPDAQPVNLDDDALVEITVEGQTQQVPWGKVKAGIQMETAARQRLYEATQLRNQAQQEYEQLHARRPADPEPAPAPAAEPEAAQKNVLDEIDWKGLGHSFQYDDPEEAGQKLRDAVEKLRGPAEAQGQQVDPEALRNSVLSQVRNTIEWEGAMKDLGTNYNDILSDPYLASLAGARANFYLNQELQREQQTGQRRPFYEVLSQATDEIRQWDAQRRGAPDGQAGDSADGAPDLEAQAQQQADVSIDTDARQQRKATASGTQPQPRVVRQRRTAAPAAGQMPDEVSRAREGIAELQKGRGQLAS